MAIDLRLPNITSKTPEGKTEQLKSYIYQLVQELNWALNAVIEEAKNESASSDDGASNSPQVIFNKIKPLIMNSKDIVDAFYYSIKTKYDDDFVFVDGDLFEFAESAKNGVTHFRVDRYHTEGYPSGYDYSFGTVEKIADGGGLILLKMTSALSGETAIKSYQGFWSDWKYIRPTE